MNFGVAYFKTVLGKALANGEIITETVYDKDTPIEARFRNKKFSITVKEI
ncbi:hypothetical protein [Clostridium sp.]|nr:hypothetical protein [Clostridium sp.]MDU1968866.1 hypothetical protein [Clostridium perfringens]MDU1822382.1 hypothetical protein [Clostridium sp.]MDU1841548.1 hypothetical protein [Clostridium sp.]MDU2689640.1 hypothetical protein [Clostridium sp.]MDU2955823.1 hypothetical protein [Clostridium sp.]